MVDAFVRGSAGQAVGRQAPQVGSVGTPTYIPQNDPHDTLIILNMHKWGKIFVNKICPSTEAPISPPRGRVRVKSFFMVSSIFEFSTSFEYFQEEHRGSNRKTSPAVCQKQNLRRPQNLLFCTTILGFVEGWGGLLGVGTWPGAPPVS